MAFFRAAILQLQATPDPDVNWKCTRDLVREAAGAGAALVATPENTDFIGPLAEKVARAEPLSGRTCRRFSELAREVRAHLLLGSFHEVSSDPRRCHNTSVLFGPDGVVMAAYRKMHLFEVDLSPGLRWVESDTVKPGEEAVVVETPLARLGLSICYDLRFGELYRTLVQRGAEVLTIPSAFTATTGAAHWETLVRARAIECQCWVIAPAQVGKHEGDGLRESWGHSMIVDPWGEVVAEIAEGVGFAVADVDREQVESVRRAMPVSRHRRLERRTDTTR